MTRDDDIIELGPEQDAAPAEAEPTYGPYDATNPPPLDFEAWAATSAALLERDGVERQGLLQSRQLEPKLWDACNQFWSLELARQMGMNNFGLATRYGILCRDELTGRAAELPAQPPAAQPPAVQPAVAQDGSGSVDSTAFLSQLPTDATLPFEQPAMAVPASPPSQPATKAEPPQERSIESTEQTAFVTALKVEDPLPFKDDGDSSSD